MIAPTTKQPTHIPMALARCLGLTNKVMISERVDGDRAAPAMPSTARATINTCGLVAWAAVTDATPNRTAPVSNSLRRPIRSPPHRASADERRHVPQCCRSAAGESAHIVAEHIEPALTDGPARSGEQLE